MKRPPHVIRRRSSARRLWRDNNLLISSVVASAHDVHSARRYLIRRRNKKQWSTQFASAASAYNDQMAMHRSRLRSITRRSYTKGIKISTVGTINTTFTLSDDQGASTKIDGFDTQSQAINTPSYPQFVEELAVTMEFSAWESFPGCF